MLMLSLTACDGDAPLASPDALHDALAEFELSGEYGSVLVTPNEGGTLELRGLRLEVPPGAVSAPIHLSARRLEDSSEGALMGSRFELTPSGTQFAVPVRLAFTYEAHHVREWLTPAMAIAAQSQGRWEVLTSLASSAAQITAETTHFSTFALIESAPDTQFIAAQSGTLFSVGGVTLESSQSIELDSMLVSPSALSMNLRADVSSTQLRLSGLVASTKLFVFDGSLENAQSVVSDSTGTVEFEQSLAGGVHSIWLQRSSGTKVIDASQPGGLDCSPVGGGGIGNWDASTQTCTLTSDVAEPIVLVSADTTLNCNDPAPSVGSHVIDTQAFPTAVALNVGSLATNVEVRDCIVRSAGPSILVSAGADGVRLRRNIVENSHLSETLHVMSSREALVEANEVTGWDGIVVDNSTDAGVLENIVEARAGIVLLGPSSTGVQVERNRVNGRAFLERFGVNDPLFVAILARGVILGGTIDDNRIVNNTLVQTDEPSPHIFSTGIRSFARPSFQGETSNEIRGNYIGNYDRGLVFNAGTGATVSFNTLRGNHQHALVINRLGLPEDVRVRFSLNDVIDNGQPQVSIDSPYALWDPDTMRGNFWGHHCGESALFESTGADSLTPFIVDSFAYGYAVASFDIDETLVPDASGCSHVTLTGNVDSDGDGLFDREEVLGIDSDGDGSLDGPLDVDFPSFGGNPLIRDLFVEFDYVDRPYSLPDLAGIRDSIAAFRRHGIILHVDVGTAAPGTDLDLGQGNAIGVFHEASMSFQPPDIAELAISDPREEPLENGLVFGAGAEIRAANLGASRGETFRYGISAPFASATTTTLVDPISVGATSIVVAGRVGNPNGGMAEVEGERFTYSTRTLLADGNTRLEGIPDPRAPDPIERGVLLGRVTIASRTNGVSHCASDPSEPPLPFFNYFVSHRDDLIQGYHNIRGQDFFHELGHCIGLNHGGAELISAEPLRHYAPDAARNRKPNYISSMNYRYSTGLPQFVEDSDGLLVESELDLNYSEVELQLLDENNLNELVGVAPLDPMQVSPYGIYYSCPGAPGSRVRALADGSPINWDCDFLGNGQPRLENSVQVNFNTPFDNEFTTLGGWDDWTSLAFNVPNTGTERRQFGPEPYELIPAFSLIPIDIRPNNPQNPINLRSRGVVKVAILSFDRFHATETVVRDGITFGLTGAEASPISCEEDDLNDDGLQDLVCRFHISDMGLDEDSEHAVLLAYTKNGTSIGGVDSVRIVP